MVRRVVFLTLGLLEVLAAAVLFVFAWETPGPAEVHDGVAPRRARHRTDQRPGRALRRQLHTLREQRPRLRELAVNLQTQMTLATNNLEGQRIDYDTVHTVEGALGDVARASTACPTRSTARASARSAKASTRRPTSWTTRWHPPPTGPPTSSISPPRRCAPTPST